MNRVFLFSLLVMLAVSIFAIKKIADNETVETPEAEKLTPTLSRVPVPSAASAASNVVDAPDEIITTAEGGLELLSEDLDQIDISQVNSAAQTELEALEEKNFLDDFYQQEGQVVDVEQILLLEEQASVSEAALILPNENGSVHNIDPAELNLLQGQAQQSESELISEDFPGNTYPENQVQQEHAIDVEDFLAPEN